MNETNPRLEAQRDRIRVAYDPTTFRAAADKLVQQLADHLRSVYASEGRVLNWAAPRDNVARAREMTHQYCEAITQQTLITRFDDIVREMLSRGQNLHDPRYVGHQVPASLPLAGLFDALGSITNQVMAVYEMGPWGTAAEQAMVGELGQRIGWPDGTYAGFSTHGGSLANLNALLVARNVALEGCWNRGLAGGTSSQRESTALPVLVVNSDAHYSVTRSAGILGLGADQVVKVGLDDRRCMNVDELDQTLQRLRSERRTIIAVVACACSTPTGAFDPLPQIADICGRHQVWLHVDAAHGGSALLSERHRHLVSGLERADSLVWDAHKMLFVPALCAFLFFKQKRHSFDAFHQHATYLFDPTAPDQAEFDLGLRTVECTRRAAAYGLWGSWSLFGPQLFADLVDVTFDLGRCLYQKLQQAPDFEPVQEPQCNIVAFRHVPQELANASQQTQNEFQRQLRRQVIESGQFYLVAANINGQDVLRVTLINPLTTAQHLDELLETLRTTGRDLLSRPDVPR